MATDKIMHRHVLKLAGPIILANISLPLLGAVDTAMMGHMDGPQYLAGLAIASTVFASIYWCLGFLRMGTTGFAAQSLGTEDKAALGLSFARAALLGLAMAFGVMLLQAPIAALAFSVLEGSDQALGAGKDYFDIRIWGAPAALVNFAIIGWMIGVQRTGDALIVQLVMNVLNAALNVLFVIEFGWGIEGIALGTVIAEYTAVALGLFLVRRRFRQLGATVPRSKLLEPAGLSRLLSVNGDIFVRTFFLMIAFAMITREGGRLGDVVLAANGILLNLNLFVAFGLDGFAQAGEALVGRSYGARARSDLRQAVRISTIWAAITAALFSLVYLLAGGLIVDLYTSIPEVQAATRTYLVWVIIAPLAAVWCFQLDGIFIGAQHTRDMRNMMVIAFAAFVAALYGLMPIWGNHGLWAAMIVFYIVRAATLAIRYPAIERAVER
ncbi:MAG: MATE family efflux transporter [Alphaproteobacteria bacterium]